MTSTPSGRGFPADGLHPDCPDLSKLGPNRAEALLRAHAARVEYDAEQREKKWSKGFTRRRLLAGAGWAGVAAFGSQLVTTRVAYGEPSADAKTIVIVFLRGGMDGMSVLVPGADPYLKDLRPNILVPESALLPMARGFGLHPALAPLHDLWKAGKFSAVPALSTPDVSRSHFQAQDCLERGGAATTSITTGWLDRVLTELGPGTTFRAIAESSTLPRALVGGEGAISLRGIESFALTGVDNLHEQTAKALRTLYTGFEHPLTTQAAGTLGALATAGEINDQEYEPAAEYPDNEFSRGLADIARLIKSNAGLRVACVDIGGWDMHTGLGTIDNGDMLRMLTVLGSSLAAFAKDLGSALDRTTLVAMTEFGRRLEENASGGLDHGHGSVALLMGGGLKGGSIAGVWEGLAPEVRDHGDVPGSNDVRDLLGELVSKRLGITTAGLSKIFPDHAYKPLGALA